MTIIDGRLVSKEVLAEVGDYVSELKTRHNLVPGLAVVIVGDDPASQIYVRRKVKKAAELSIFSEKHELPKSASENDVLELVEQLNNNSDIHGILVQSPPPPGIDERRIVETINPMKDVDCFHPYNVGRLTIGDEDGFYPCTPAGIMVLLKRNKIEIEGKNAVVLGRSNIVGKPMAILLSRKSKSGNATVTICHSRSQNLGEHVRNADLIVAAIGRPNFVTGDMVKNNVVVIDVGINRIDDSSAPKGYRLAGDVDFDGVSKKASHITPVPGGVGPMTIAILMHNTIKACCLQNDLPLPPALF